MADLPQQGESLPDLELTSESGEHIGRGELTGKKTVLFFYPKDDTPGCTKEACAFRDHMDEYAKAGIQVYGVSLDSPESHRGFREKYSLNFPLLTDEGGRASEVLGVLREDRKRTKRVTFLLDPEGRISKVYPEVTPDTHAEEILEDAASI
ncbi:MAG TPA: peroxiredoxin [Rubrobacter sp.]|jgi:thioredoxin-dependent peroxiredoxin|nr:peroxiredoxin [Rubrobacter sp.]